MIGAISFFHSMPSDDLNATTRKLNLDRCVLSGIFQRTIKTWDDPAIKALNPGMVVPTGQAITVVVRVAGSSSTSLSSQYLSTSGTDAGCSTTWAIGAGKGGTGTAPTWPAGVVSKEGSGGVSGHIAATPYSIGYIDSGHGHSSGLAEIALKNKDGNYLTSKEAGPAGIAAAAAAAVSNALAADMSLSWDAVTLMNQPGATTWPICTFSYLYLRKDMTDASLLHTGPLVKAFAEFVLSAEGQGMVPEFGFNGIPASLLASAKTALDTILLNASATAWTFETSTTPGAGMGPKVFSVKRTAYADYERGVIAADVATMKAQVADLRSNEVVQLHGSGTTNPKKFFWKAMDILEERAMVPMTMTYRAVGSGTGQYEFKGLATSTPAYTPWNHFGSGGALHVESS
jgi:ABC-type phosphate transport system substrate-binding protein